MHAAPPLHPPKKAKHRHASFTQVIDTSVYAVSVFGVLANIPQLVRIWFSSDVSGVSPISWVCFLALSFFWFTYGLVHKEKPIILANALLIIVQALIIWGIVIDRSGCLRPIDILLYAARCQPV